MQSTVTLCESSKITVVQKKMMNKIMRKVINYLCNNICLSKDACYYIPIINSVVKNNIY